MMFEGLNINAAPWGSTPVTASPPQLGSSDPYPEKKELCRFYVNGGCTKGSTCQYSHDLVIEAPDGSTGGGGFILNRGVANAHHASPGVPRSGATSSGIGASPLTATPPTLGWQGGAASGGVSWGVQGMPSDGSQQQHTAVLLSQQHSGGYAAYGDPSQGGGGGYGDLHRTGSMAHANSYGDLSSAAAGAGGDGGALAFNGAQSSVFAARLSQQQSPAPTSDYPATTAEHHQAILRRFTYGGATTASSAMMPSYFPTSTAPNGRVDYVDPSSQPTGALLFAPHHMPATGADENAAVIAAYLQQQQQQGGYYVATDGTTVSSSGLAVYPAGGGVQPVILASTADLFPALPGAGPTAMAPQSATLYATTTAPAPQAVMTQQPMPPQQLGAEDSYAQKLQRAAQQQQQQAAQQQQQLTPATPTGYGQPPKAMPGLTPYPAAAGPAPGMPGFPGQPQTPGAATPQNPAPVPATFDIDASLAALLGRGNNSQAAAAAAIMTAAATANRNTGSTQAITELQRILSRISAGDTASLSTGSSPQTSPVKPPASENKVSAGAIGAPVATPAAQPTPYVDPAVIDASQAGPRDRKAAGAEEPSNGAASQSPAGGNSPSAGAGYRGGYRRGGGGGGGGGYDRRESRDGQHGGRRAGEDDYTEAYDDRRPASAGYPIGRVNNAGRNGSGSSEPQPAAAPSGGKGGKGGAVATPEPAHHADPRSAAGYRPQSGGRGGGQRETGYVVPGPRSATQATASSGPIAVPRSAAAAAAAAAASKPAAAQAPAQAQQGRAPVGGAQPNPSGGRGKNGGGRGR